MAELRRISFVVYTQPAPQGSKSTVPIFKGGKPVMVGNRTLTRVKDDSPRLGTWRQQVAEVARKEYEGEPIDGPIRLTLRFVRPRPASHYGTGKNRGKLKASAPIYPTTRPDTSKLLRAVEDALAGVLWTDDARVVRHVLAKDFGAAYATEVVVEEMRADPDSNCSLRET